LPHSHAQSGGDGGTISGRDLQQDERSHVGGMSVVLGELAMRRHAVTVEQRLWLPIDRPMPNLPFPP